MNLHVSHIVTSPTLTRKRKRTHINILYGFYDNDSNFVEFACDTHIFYQ